MTSDLRTKLGLPNKSRVEVQKYDVKRDRPSRPHNKKKEGHDDLIARLRWKFSITIQLREGDTVHGVLQESDRFTITVRTPKDGAAVEDAIDNPDKILLVYKHAIESFYLTKLPIFDE